jgi:hypothetical protein
VLSLSLLVCAARYSECLADCDRCLDVYPNDENSLFMGALCLHAVGRFKAAIDRYVCAILRRGVVPCCSPHPMCACAGTGTLSCSDRSRSILATVSAR